MKVKRRKEGARSSWSATPLWNHLKRHYPEEHKAASEQENAAEMDAKQRKLDEEKEKEKHPGKNPETRRRHQKEDEQSRSS